MPQYGFKAPVIVPEDFWLGSGKLGSVDLNPTGDWRAYLPIFEHQRKAIETQACVSFGTLSALEMLHKLQYGSEPNYADRYTARVSETDPYGGNTPKVVSGAIKSYGTVAEAVWPFAEPLDEYYKDIPIDVLGKGMDWLREFSFGYEWVAPDKLKSALRRSPVGVAVSAWTKNDKGEYIRAGGSNHWCVLVAFDEQDRPVIWDSYDEGLKTLAKDHSLEFCQMYTLRKIAQKKTSFWQRLKEWLW